MQSYSRSYLGCVLNTSVKMLLPQRDSVMRCHDFCERVLVDPCKFIEFLFSNRVFGRITATPALKVEQQHTIKFCCYLGKPATEAYILIKQAYGDGALARAMMFCWRSEFTSGRENAKLIPHSGSPRTSRTEINKNTIVAIVAEDPLIVIKELSTVMDLVNGSV